MPGFQRHAKRFAARAQGLLGVAEKDQSDLCSAVKGRDTVEFPIWSLRPKSMGRCIYAEGDDGKVLQVGPEFLRPLLDL